MKMISEKRAIDKIFRRRDRYDIPDWQRQEVWNREKKQRLIDSIVKDATLDAKQRTDLVAAANRRLTRGFRDNTWFLQTRGTDYDLVPPAKKRVPVVRTIYAEADGVALPEPDPANAQQREFGWMTVHQYTPSRPVERAHLEPAGAWTVVGAGEEIEILAAGVERWRHRIGHRVGDLMRLCLLERVHEHRAQVAPNVSRVRNPA